MTFVYRPKPAKVEEQKDLTGNPPIDAEPPFNFPNQLNLNWTVLPVGGNLYMVMLKTPVTLTGGVDDVPAASSLWRFWHRVIDLEFFQVDAAGARVNDPLTYEWAHQVLTDYAVIRRRALAPRHTIRLEGARYPSSLQGEQYRWRFEGTATNVVSVTLWIEVLRV